MTAFKLAYRNLIGAGLRTWLNVIVLSIAYFLIIYLNGIYNGWDHQAKRDMIAWEIGQGQYWHEAYDPYDIFTLADAHAKIPAQVEKSVTDGDMTPVLISQGTIYPEGRMQTVFLRGMDPAQKIVEIPTGSLTTGNGEINAVIGKRMAANSHLKVGDYVMLRWRDANGTFDAAEIKIAAIFNNNVPAVDNGQIYISLENLQKMTQMPGEATMMILGENFDTTQSLDGWILKDHDFLLATMNEMIAMKRVGGSIFYGIIMMLALLAVFDTQILSIFRRQREIGTFIAMGMTRSQVVGMFTIEGTMHAILAALIGAVYGIPVLTWLAIRGWAMPQGTDDFGLPIADKIYPTYSVALVFLTITLVLLTTAIVSYLPSRKIAKMNPTLAIKGKIQ